MKRVRYWSAHAFWAILSLFLTFVLIFTIFDIYSELQLPNVESLKDIHLQVPLRIYTADSKLIAQYGSKRRIPVKLSEIPPPLIHAVLATEDARFYDHPGVDLIGLLRAAKVVITSGKKSQGASTITMQVARNFFLNDKKTYRRKINEILLALKINSELSKDKILELYLNKIYFGNRAYGVAAAADVYYGKTLKELTLPEIAMIAGLPQAPSRNNPIDNLDSAIKRRNHVLERMLELKYITQDQYSQAVSASDSAHYHATPVDIEAPYVSEMVRESIVRDYGPDAYERGLIVYTSLSSSLQNMANQSLRTGLLAYDKRHGYRGPNENLGEFDSDAWIQALKKQPIVSGLLPAVVIDVNNDNVQALLSNGETINVPWQGLSWARPALEGGEMGSSPHRASDVLKMGDVIRVKQNDSVWELSQIPEAEGAFVAMNPKNGAILALVGGFNYERSNFNRVTQAERQPGSNFKPFIYSAALAKGFTLASVINDAPIVENDTSENILWRPMNDTRKFYGPTSLRVGLSKSRNLISIRLLQNIGIDYTLDYLKRFGFDTNTLPHGLSLALGTGTVTPLQIATGYSVFANGGEGIRSFFIERIEDGHQVLFQEKKSTTSAVIEPQNAYLITQVLRDVLTTGTAKAARELNRKDLAGKTGTTNELADAWFSGFNSDLEATVWVGFDNLKSLKEYGAQAALPIWMDFMHAALQGQPLATMAEPSGIVSMRIDPQTGLLARPNQPHATFEIFDKRYIPKHYSSEPHEYSDEKHQTLNNNEDAEPLF